MISMKARKGPGTDTGNRGHFAGVNRDDADVSLEPTASQTDALGGIIGAHYTERTVARPRVLKDLNMAQQRAVLAEVESLDTYRRKPRGGRAIHRYEVMNAGTDSDVLYIQSRPEVWTYSEDIMRVELGRDGQVLAAHIGLVDNWGVKWLERDADAADGWSVTS